MPRVRSVEKHKDNPFVTGQLATTRKRRVTVKANRAIVNRDTGEFEDAVELVKLEEVDDEKFVKLYTQNLRAFFSLKPSTYKLVEILLYEMQKHPNLDRVYLNVDEAEKYFEQNGEKPISRSTFHTSIRELIDKGFIAQSTATNLFFINPAIFFNGDRVRFVKEYRRKRSKAEALEDSGQMTLLERKQMDLEEALAEKADSSGIRSKKRG